MTNLPTATALGLADQVRQLTDLSSACYARDTIDADDLPGVFGAVVGTLATIVATQALLLDQATAPRRLAALVDAAKRVHSSQHVASFASCQHVVCAAASDQRDQS